MAKPGNQELARLAVCLAVMLSVGCSDVTPPPPVLPVAVLAVFDLGTYPGTDGSGANAVNADGWVVGWSARSTVLQPVIWSPDRTIALVDTILPCTALDINTSRWVVGQCYSNTAVLWRAPSDRITLDTVAAPSGAAVAINELGQAAGLAVRCSMCVLQRAVLWEADGALRYLDPRDGDVASAAADVNASGDVAGTSFTRPAVGSDPPVTHAVTWRSGTIVDLGALPTFPASEAIALNDSGVVVGNSCTPTCYVGTGDRLRGFLWDNGALTDLGNRMPSAINNHGVVVGNSESGPFVWAGGRLAELDAPPATTSCSVQDINDAGHVVGACMMSGFLRAILWVIRIDP